MAQGRVLTNTAFEPPWFGHENTSALGNLTRRDLAIFEDYERFTSEHAALAAKRRYFNGLTGFAYVGHRWAA